MKITNNKQRKENVMFAIASPLMIPAMLLGLAIYGTMIACAVIATVSLVRIARSLDKLAGKSDDLKRELEKMKGKTE
jgi:membrane protein implicated in regulation of membrane protease activity